MVVFFSFQGVVTNFEIFRMREKQVPVDVVEMKGTYRVLRNIHACVGPHTAPSIPGSSPCALSCLPCRGHHRVRVGAQRQQVCGSPRGVSPNQLLLLPREEQREDRSHK